MRKEEKMNNNVTRETEIYEDEVLMKIARAVYNDEQKNTAVVPEREEQVRIAYNLMKRIVSDENVKVSYELHKPFPSSGSVSAEGKEIIIENPTLFAKIAEIATNLEVYPKVNGNVVMSFAFDGLTTNRVSQSLKTDKQKQLTLERCSKIIDTLSERFGGTSYEVEMDKETPDTIIAFVCEEFSVYTASDDFYKLVRKAKKVEFKSYEEERIQIYFTLDSVWN